MPPLPGRGIVALSDPAALEMKEAMMSRPLSTITFSRRAALGGAGASLAVLAAAPVAAKAKVQWRMPVLPPMPPLAPARPEESVTMADPAKWPETKLDFPIADGPYAGDWQSIIRNYPTDDIAWLREAKFGIWVHFGAQSSGNAGDWYAKRMYDQSGRFGAQYKSHLKNFGHPSEVGYKEVLRQWNPDKLDPAALIKLYEEAGARFLFLLGVHHDNFDNWDSRYQKWNAVNLGPKRDLIGEWTKAARAAGIRYGITFHHEYTWWWWQTAFGADKTGPKAGVPYDAHLTKADGKGTWWDGYDPRMLYTINLREYKGLDTRWAPPGGIFQNHQAYARWYATWWAYRIMDAIEKYDPDFIYTDGDSNKPFTGFNSGTGASNDAMQRVIAHYYNRSLQRRGKVDTFSIVKFRPPTKGVVRTHEGSFPEEIKRDQPWVGETAVGDWFYGPGFVYDPGTVVRYLLETASRDGACAVCIPQRPDGSLDAECVTMLKRIGRWMRVHGEGIYGSSAWQVLGEGQQVDGKLKVATGGALGARQVEDRFGAQDFRFTQGKNGAIYAYCMTVPEGGSELTIRSLGSATAGAIRQVALLGYPEPLRWRQTGDALLVTLPALPDSDIAIGLKVER
ncbi:alpha-L-fucosidase [Sphingomonas sp. NFR04]|uniref:alpha-L-fucosidase n=1 Tax=Sphingomonas sp. NFR04 TaxID=1566283 RepID=UPI0008EC14BB|nr:alpha-L-fucosidase [Sphingomonas sp. NFR04]SFK51747.1 alpha-L-fucosidase [Sphingomonas sp. NFR04]